MTSEPKRKLVAIMFTDMVGYTAMMQEDEDKARELIQRHRDLMKPIIEKYNGEILQYVGDGTFCSFESAIESANCAVEIQGGFKTDKEISLRIGIHVGDVVIDGDEVYGDGVNVASRLEPLSAPGGVNISGRVYDDLKNHKDISVESLGEIKLKNVKEPMSVYALSGEDLVVSKLPDSAGEAVTEEVKTKPASKRLLTWAVGAVVLLILFFVKGWFTGESSITEVTADENSLAVLFIENMMDPSDSERHAEMIKELLITDLSQSHDLRIIGGQRLYDIAKRNRKGEDRIIDRSNASEVAREAGARWMLVGKLSKIGSQMVLTTQIESVRDGKIVDSQRADSEDLFALVDMLTKEVKADLGFVSKPGEIDAPVTEITTSSSEAYQLYLKGLNFLNEINYGEAIERFERAVELDPTFTKALYKLAVAQWWFETGTTLAQETVKKILLNKENLSEGELLLVKGLGAMLDGDYSTAKDLYQRLLLKYPDDKEIHYGLGEAYFHSDKPEPLKTLNVFEEAIDLDPDFTIAYAHIFNIYQLERMDDRAIRVANRLIDSNPDKVRGYRYLARVYGWIGDLEKSIKNYEKVAELNKENYQSVLYQSWAYRIGGDYEKALNEYAELFKPDVPVIQQYQGKLSSSYIYAEQGQYKKAIQLVREARRVDEQFANNNMDLLAEYYASSADTIRALAYLDSLIAMSPSIEEERFNYLRKGVLYAASGDQEELKKLIETLEISKNQKGVFISMNAHNILRIELYLFQADIEKAIIEYNKLDLGSLEATANLKARLYAANRDWENFILATQSMQSSGFSNFRYTYNYPRAFYIKGKAYEEMGKPDLAIENYEALLELWEDADKGIPEKLDTIKRLAALKQES